jgi:hypothetical protein
MDDANKRALLAERVAGRRRELAGRASLDPRHRMLPPRCGELRSPLTILLLATLGAVALVVCATLAVGVVLGSSWLQGTLNDPSSTAQTFLSALQTRDYDQAYTLLSRSARSHQSQTAFESQFTGYDTIEGPVTNYSLATPTFSKDGAVATINVRVQRKGSAAAPQYLTITLVKDPDNWRIGAIAVRSHAVTPSRDL